METWIERGHFVYWLMPEMYPDPGLPRTKMLRFAHPRLRQRGQSTLRNLLPPVLMEQFPDPVGPVFADLVFTNDAYYALLLQQYFSTRRFVEWTPVVAYDNYPTALDWEEQTWVSTDGDESMLYSRAMGYALSEPVACSPCRWAG